MYGCSTPEVFLGKGLLKICSKFTDEYSCRSVISISFKTTLLKSHFGMSVLYRIRLSYIFKILSISNEKPSISIEILSTSIEILDISNQKF